MKKIAFKKGFAIFVMLSLLCAGCVPAQSRTVSAEVKFPLAVRDCAPKQMMNYYNVRYYLGEDHVLYGWGVIRWDYLYRSSMSRINRLNWQTT